MASKKVKFCANSRKRIVQLLPQEKNKQVLNEDAVNDSEQQIQESDIDLSGCRLPDTNTGVVHKLKGRRIINIAYFFEQVQELDLHSRNGGCNFSNMECCKEIKRGLASYFFFKCAVCGFSKYIASERCGAENDINKAAVLASNGIGIGFHQAKELFTNLGIPFMISNEYNKQQKILMQPSI